jgi:hypothetical protein
MSQPHRILFKFPTRGRADRFFSSLDSILNNLWDRENFQVQITADVDDKAMTDKEVLKKLEEYPRTFITYGISNSKIDAVNRDLPLFKDYDIICCHSDDMKWQFFGFDQIIRQEFEDGDLDKLLHIPDSDAKEYLATYYIAGKDYFKRFNYIYHPSYKSLFCDNEVQEIAMKLGKYKFVSCSGMLFHEHPSYGHIGFDEQYQAQQALWGEDELNYHTRKARNFDL